MTGRRWVFLGTAIAMLGLIAGLVAFIFSINAYSRVRLGMTPEQVEAVMGEAPTKRTVCKYGVEFGSGIILVMPCVGKMAREIGVSYPEVPEEWPLDGWKCDEDGRWLWVAYDPDGRAIGIYLVDSRFRKPTLFGRVRDWMGL